jgi:hypothetical protein
MREGKGSSDTFVRQVGVISRTFDKCLDGYAEDLFEIIIC